ncbi:chloride channel protein [Ruminococcus sp. Marseille-P6503]|uniref:chloride channel protein n=1 Tax=Ruminococcus sp. Marseille-P6503 TaxID=2364796 RepID=UPI001FAB1900|nr:chloride channel protein [Ruminococcus sp. Marseille-P6503]
MINGNYIKNKAESAGKFVSAFVKWVLISTAVGAAGGIAGSLFHMAVNKATEIRESAPWLVCFLPLGGIVIVFLYKAAKTSGDAGTNLIIGSIRTHTHVPVLMAPLIFISTCITHLLGGSAGREGAALQLGGSIGAKAGELLHLDEKDTGLVIMCGMSSVFSALFGTPLTACFFAMEVISVGVIYYVGLVPCLGSALVAYKVSLLFRVEPTRFSISEYVPSLDFTSVAQVGALSALCAAVSILFCMTMKYTHDNLNSLFSNAYIKALAGGIFIAALTFILGTYDYNGAGMGVIAGALEQGSADWYDFIFKIIFTAVTIGAGFKGGEIVPTIFIGSSFGCAAAPLLGMEPRFGAAVGVVALFCGVVNCPAAAIFLSLEMFGSEGLLLFAAASGVSYMLSGYYGLYSSQKIVYSKVKPEYINVNAK